MSQAERSWNRVIDIRDQPKSQHKPGLDGMMRSIASEKALNRLAADVFETPAGQEWMNYMRSITLNNVTGPGIDDCALRHLEGQRYQVGLTLQRIERGKQGI